MTNFNPQEAARSWVAAWNRRDLADLLPHYSPDVLFISPIASDVVGNPILRGRVQLEIYWRKALAERRNLHFELEHVLWDEPSRLLCLLYTSVIDGRHTLVSECQWFDDDGLISRSTAYYGPEVTPAALEA